MMLMLLACTCSIEFRSMGKQRTKYAFAIPLGIECVVSSALVQLTRVSGGCVQSCNFTISHAPVGTYRSQLCMHTHIHTITHTGGVRTGMPNQFQSGLKPVWCVHTENSLAQSDLEPTHFTM